MSTRAVIARQTNDGWEGVYQHSDGYPTGLGRELWSTLHHEHGGNVSAFVHAVIDAHAGGWSHFAPAIPAELWDAYKESGFSAEFFAAHAIRECYCHSLALLSAKARAPGIPSTIGPKHPAGGSHTTIHRAEPTVLSGPTASTLDR